MLAEGIPSCGAWTKAEMTSAMNTRQILTLFLGTALLASCGDGKDAASRENGFENTAVADPAARYRSMPEKELIDLAFKAAFNTPGHADMTVGDTRYAFTPQAVRWVGNRAVLISGGQSDNCHGCAGTLAVHYLEPRGNGLAVVGAWPEAASGTSYGQPPEWTLRTDLASNPVLQTEGGGTFQGYSCTNAQLVELTPAAPVTIADNVQLHFSNEGAVVDGGAESIDGKIMPGARDQNFTVSYGGTTSAQIVYKRQGTRFEKATGAPDIPSC